MTELPEFCTHERTWFDRIICPEPCGQMHYYCLDCGQMEDHCRLDDEPQPQDSPEVMVQRLTAERDALAAQLDALRGRIEGLRDEFRRWVACDEPIAATGEWQASGYMRAYLNRAAVFLDAALAAAPQRDGGGVMSEPIPTRPASADPKGTLPTMAEVLSSATVRYSPAVLDRVLAAHDAQVRREAKVEALREAADEDFNQEPLYNGPHPFDVLNARADRIEREGGEE